MGAAQPVWQREQISFTGPHLNWLKHEYKVLSKAALFLIFLPLGMHPKLHNDSSKASNLPYYGKLTLVLIKVFEINVTKINANWRKITSQYKKLT